MWQNGGGEDGGVRDKRDSLGREEERVEREKEKVKVEKEEFQKAKFEGLEQRLRDQGQEVKQNRDQASGQDLLNKVPNAPMQQQPNAPMQQQKPNPGNGGD